ncbi:MAG: PAS domain S-box protein [Gemmatimonadetes bacterium]|nr:PAS domain S-box protein [Gemmatimonadota bacterium]
MSLVPPRALALSLGALSASVIGALVFSDSAGEYEAFLWLLALVPAFLLAHYRGWAWVSAALGGGMALLSLTYVLGWSLEWEVRDWPVYLFVVGSYIAIALGAGWFSEVRHAAVQRKEAEEALRKSEERYRTMFEQSRDAILITSRDGRHLDVNRAALELFGYTREEMLALDSRQLYAEPGDRDGFVEKIDRDGFVHDHQVTLRRKDGSEMSCLVTSTLQRADDGTVLGYQAIIRDVTAQRQLERYLQEVQKMEAVDQLSSGIAHDFNNILTVVLTSAVVLREFVNSEQTDARALLDDLQDVAKRGSQLVKKLSIFARREEVKLVPLDLAACVDELAETLRRLLPENVEIHLAVDEPLPPVLADVGAVEQILMNLATNARDAMPRGGTLRIVVGRTQLADEDRARHGWVVPGKYVSVSVSDTGVGMDEKTREKVFQPFFTTKPPGEGTGLGMAVVYGLVKQHKGFVHLYSQPGLGTTVKVYFPVAEGAAGVVSRTDARPELPRGSETILLVEDEPAVRRTARRTLEKLGYTVLEAADGQEALELYRGREAEIDLILSDVVMPRLGGKDLYEALRREGKGVKFLFVSGYTAHDVRESVRLDPALAFLQKPWTGADLAHKVRETLGALEAEGRAGG